MIDYVKEKYGRPAVSQIATFGTMAAKAALRDVGRVLGMGYGMWTDRQAHARTAGQDGDAATLPPDFDPEKAEADLRPPGEAPGAE